ncbi:MAG: Ig-like domain-containing protein [Bacteroidales bacterium]|nr:Ig-like domain-containing protein [Bacteroidales bacterium]
MKIFIRHNIFILLTLLLGAVSEVFAGDRFYIDTKNIEPGETRNIEFVLENTQDFYGFQVDIELPDGLEFVKFNGKVKSSLSPRADDTYSIVSNLITEKSLRLGTFSVENNPFTGNNGDLLYVSVKAQENFTGGVISVTNVLFTNSLNKDVRLVDSFAELGYVYNNSFYIPDFNISAGETKTISMILDNETPFSAFQTDIYMPEGLNIVAESFELTSRASLQELPKYLVLASSGNESMGTVSATEGKVSKGSSVTLTATPAEGYEFKNWTVDGVVVSTQNPYNAVITDDTEFVATFQREKEQIVVQEVTTNFIAYQSYYVTNLIDGSYTTKFWSNASQDLGKYIMLDLGKVYNVEDIKLYFTDADQPTGATIETSVNATDDSWMTIATFTKSDILNVTEGSSIVNRYTCNAKGAEARYVRMRISTNEPEFWLQMTEFKVYGREFQGSAVEVNDDVAVANNSIGLFDVESSNIEVFSSSEENEQTPIVSDHTISVKSFTDGRIRIACFSPSNTIFVGDSGALLNFKVEATNVVSDSELIELKNQIFSTYDSKEYVLENSETSVTIERALVQSIILEYSSLDLIVDESRTIATSISPTYASNKELKWSSSDENVVTVSPFGVVTAVGIGSATVTATAVDGSGVNASCNVNVVKYPLSISISNESLQLNEGENYQLIAEILPIDATDKSVLWISSNENVVYVDQTGLIEAIAEGEAEIRVSSIANPLISDVCIVTVTNESGVESVNMDNSTIITRGNEIIVKGSQSATIYNINGTCIAHKIASDGEIRFFMLYAGVYIVNTGEYSLKVIIK